MRLIVKLANLSLPAFVLASCSAKSPRVSPGPTTVTAEVEKDQATNPLLEPWSGPHGGSPAFDRVRLQHFKPAIEASMAASLAEMDGIAGNREAPTFDNTIAALQRSGRQLDRALTVYNIWSGGLQSPEFQAIEAELEPELAAYKDQITQNEALFARIQAVAAGGEHAAWTAEQRRLVEKIQRDFVRAGAALDSTSKARLSAINQDLARLFTAFSKNVLADESEPFLLLEHEDDLAGLPGTLRDAAATEAEARGLAGQWVIRNTRSAIAPFLSFATRRDLREKAFRMFVERGDRGGATDNKAIITKILALRAERARLLGYPTHAHWRLENTMAKTPERAMALLKQVWTPAVKRVREEVADMQAIADADKANITIEPWDYRFFAERVRAQKYDLDTNVLKPYLQLEKLREAMFWVAGELFGLAFEPVADVPTYHPDVRVWRVFKRGTGAHVGLWFFDPYARSGKRSGAWMNAYRRQESFEGAVTPIVSNNANFIKGRPGEPVLISWDDATTLFHEFGHALHGLCSDVSYPELAGTAVYRDYVEFPSQLLERWLATPEVLQRFAVHVETGQPIPPELIARIERASTFNIGFDTVEYLASAFVDMKVHLAGATPIDPAVFERDTLAALGMPREIVMRHRMPQFLHVFADDSYSAGYYSYLWADMITADAYQAFVEAGGPYDTEVAARLLRFVFSVGNTVDPVEGYRSFRGRDATVDALMKKRGFAGTGPG